MIKVKDLRQLADRFARLDVDAVADAALGRAATRMADAVRAALSAEPGSAHDQPWLRTGRLRDSISVRVAGGTAVVGSTSEAAVFQEFGTRTDPPRPFMAPVAVSGAAAAGTEVGTAVAAVLRGE